MSTEAALLYAITANRSDNAARLVYADWLDENDESDRAAYIRLQVELVREWWYDKPCTDLYARIAWLAARLDANWLATVRRCTTPAPPVNVEEVLPELRGKGKTAVRLHPRPGEAPVDASKIGGMFLWPKNEPWPVCPIHGNIPYTTALQLRKEDVPELGFPPNTDLFQLLWCPEQHDEDDMYCPKPAAYWRKRSGMKQTLKVAPVVEREYIPQPCIVYPERLTEYPSAAEFFPDGCHDLEEEEYPLALRSVLKVIERLAVGGWQAPDDCSELYERWLCVADGTKVGGYPAWVQDMEYPRCGCGAVMEHILSLASCEFDGVTWGRWLTIEDRPMLLADFTKRRAVENAHRCHFGDVGKMYVFVCRKHREPHVRAFMQCS